MASPLSGSVPCRGRTFELSVFSDDYALDTEEFET